jgi:hypothetical protein
MERLSNIKIFLATRTNLGIIQTVAVASDEVEAVYTCSFALPNNLCGEGYSLRLLPKLQL